MHRNPHVMHRSEWERLRVQVRDDKALNDAEIQTAYVKGLNEASYNMTKTWENSYERILQRQEEERQAKKKAEDDARMEFYRQLLEKKRVEREQMLAEARDTFFKQKDEPKTLTSAFMCSEVLREQESQRAFNAKLRAEEKERERLYSEDVKQKSEEWLQEQRDKYQRRREKNREILKFITAQKQEAHDRQESKKRQQFMEEKEDIKNSNHQMEEIRKFEIEFKLKERRALRNQGEESIMIRNKKKQEEKDIEDLEEKLIDIWEKTNCKMKTLTEKRRQELVDQKAKITNILKSKYPNLEKKRLEKEEENYLRAREVIEQREEALLNKKKEMKEVVKQDRKKCFEVWQAKDAENREKLATFGAWEIANRFENTQHAKRFEQIMREKTKQDVAEYKEFILKQKEQLDAEKAREAKERYKFYHTDRLTDMEAADNKFMKFANNLIEECKEANRPINPLVKVIDDYKSRYMNPAKRIPKHLKTNIVPFSSEKEIQNKKKACELKKEQYKLEKHPEVREPRICPTKDGLQSKGD